LPDRPLGVLLAGAPGMTETTRASGKELGSLCGGIIGVGGRPSYVRCSMPAHNVDAGPELVSWQCKTNLG
jgi:hypothetical protein